MTDKPNIQSDNEKIQYVALNPEMLSSHSADDEIDLKELWNAIWKGKWIIIITTMIFASTSVFYALSLSNVYKSEALLAPASNDQQSGLSGLSSQFGGLASLAGINLSGGKTDKTVLAIEILKSREFISSFIQKYKILPDLMAVDSWDRNTNQIIYDYKNYDATKKVWLREVEPPKLATPSIQEASVKFKDIFGVTISKENGMVSLGVEHHSPYVAKQWVDWLVRDINQTMKGRDRDEAIKSIAYLQSQVSNTAIAENKALLYQLIEEQTKTLMFTEIRDEYVFKVIDSPIIPEMKFKPNRTLIVLIGGVIGGLLSVFFVLVRYFASANRTS